MPNKTILLLEDDTQQRDRMTKILEKAGYTVISFEHPQSARIHFRENDGLEIDAIVSDWNMGRGKMTGLDFLQSVRHGNYNNSHYKSKIFSKTPFVMCSSYDPNKRSEAIYKETALENEADRYQCKAHNLQPMIDFLDIITNKK